MRCFLLIVLFMCAALFEGDFAYAAYDLPYIGETRVYEARYEDTLVHVARDYNLGYVEIRAANPDVDPWIPGAGVDLVLPMRHILPDAPHEGVVINLPEMRLYTFLQDDEEPQSFPIGVGREGLDTPIGETKVTWKKEGPTWRPTVRMREEDPTLPESIGPGPENPLGSHALYLGWPQYAIHGTDKPFGIGRRVSSGCIRLYPEDIVELFDAVPKGTKVRVVDQPLKLAWIEDKLYLEAHPDLEQAFQMEEVGYVAKQTLDDKDLQQVIKVAGDEDAHLDWPVIRRVIRERKGYPVVVGHSISEDEQHAKSEHADKPVSKTREMPRYNQ